VVLLVLLALVAIAAVVSKTVASGPAFESVESALLLMAGSGIIAYALRGLGVVELVLRLIRAIRGK
jgi:hypothetical protein